MAIIIKKRNHNCPAPDALVAPLCAPDGVSSESVSYPPKTETITPQTLAEVIDLISHNQALSASRKRDLISACNSIARLTGRSPDTLPADVPLLRNLIGTLHPVQGRMSKKRLANIRADLAAALEATGVITPSDPTCEPSPDWKTFLSHANKPHQAWFLSRFARYCSYRHISPVDVTDDTIRTFQRWLDARVLTSTPAKIVKQTAVSFNTIIKQAQLNLPLLTTASGTRFLTRPLDTYPQSLIDDIERYLKRLSDPDLFSDEGPRRPLRPTSINNITAHIRQFLHAAVEAGYKQKHFETLADVVDLNVIESAIGQMLTRHDGRFPTSLGNIIATLLAIGRHYLKLDARVLSKISLAQRKIGDELGTRQRTMSVKSQRRMDQFEDNKNVACLANLPMNLIRKAQTARNGKSAVLDAMCAAAIAILLSCPMRMKNLAALCISEDFTIIRKGKAVTINIHITAAKTKGRKAIDAVIEPPYSTVIDKYLTHYRKHVGDSSGGWLFPSASGTCRTPDHFAELIKNRIFRETGLTMNAHLFRHFGAYVYLEAHPGHYEDVRRIVGHSKMETTTTFYAPASNKAAFKRYADVLRPHITDKGRRK